MLGKEESRIWERSGDNYLDWKIAKLSERKKGEE